MSKKLKEMIGTYYKKSLGSLDGAIFIDFAKIPAEELRAFRAALTGKKLDLLVVKNTVFAKALAEKKISGLDKIAQGQTAVIHGSGEAVAQRAAQFLEEWAGTHKPTVVRGGVLEGAAASPDEVKGWKDLLTREQMLSKLVGQIIGVGAKLASQISGMGGALASQIQQRGEGKGTPPPAAE